jgi:hypothetical protein
MSRPAAFHKHFLALAAAWVDCVLWAGPPLGRALAWSSNGRTCASAQASSRVHPGSSRNPSGRSGARSKSRRCRGGPAYSQQRREAFSVARILRLSSFLRASEKHRGSRHKEVSRHSGEPDHVAQRLCPDAPGFLNLVPGTWTRAQLPRLSQHTPASRSRQTMSSDEIQERQDSHALVSSCSGRSWRLGGSRALYSPFVFAVRSVATRPAGCPGSWIRPVQSRSRGDPAVRACR